MRTTVDIEAPILREVKRVQKKEAKSLGRKVRRLAVACARNAVGRNGNTPEEPVSVQALGILVFLARKAGQVKGSIKHRVWYV